MHSREHVFSFFLFLSPVIRVRSSYTYPNKHAARNRTQQQPHRRPVQSSPVAFISSFPSVMAQVLLSTLPCNQAPVGTRLQPRLSGRPFLVRVAIPIPIPLGPRPHLPIGFYYPIYPSACLPFPKVTLNRTRVCLYRVHPFVTGVRRLSVVLFLLTESNRSKSLFLCLSLSVSVPNSDGPPTP